MKNLITKLIISIIFTFSIDTITNAKPINSFITNVSPAINSMNTLKSQNIFIYFSQSMNASTVNNSGIKVYGLQSGLMTTNITYNALTNTVSINPDAAFKTGELVNVILDNTIQTSLNISIEPFSFYFTILSSRGDGDFTSTDITNGNLKPDDMISGDFDNDGSVDLMTLNKESHKAAFLKNNGSGIFNLNNTFIIDPVEIQSFTAADLDGDGDLDLAFIIGVYAFFDLQIFLNNGNGTFATGNRHDFIFGRTGRNTMKSYDIDNDGDLDLLPLFGDRFFGRIAVFLNNGNAVFTEANEIAQNNCFEGNTLATDIGSYGFEDINNDGSSDAFLECMELSQEIGCNCEMECFTIQVRTNNGHGIFSDQATYSFTERHAIICSGDFNNDGYADIICDRLLLRNNGDGNFTTVPVSVEGIVGIAGDFESDGDLDVVTTDNNSVKFYKNNGDGTFLAPVNFATGSNPKAICSGNFDGDCDLDIATSNHTDNNVTSLFNSSNIVNCAMTGPDLIPVGTESVLYTTVDQSGYWEIINIPPCNATIAGGNENMSVYVNAGFIGGGFILYHHNLDDCGWELCSKAISVDDPLPVELTSFISIVNVNNVLLNWSTSSEINNSGFDVESSNVKGQTSNDWTKISFVQGNGTTSTPNNYEFTDKNLSSGKYNYRLKQIDFNGNFEYFNLSNEVVIGVPEKFELSQNYPNPFNPATKIDFDLPNEGKVSIILYDITGREIANLVNEVKTAGYYTLQFNASNLASGMYFYRIVSGNFVASKKMMVLK